MRKFKKRLKIFYNLVKKLEWSELFMQAKPESIKSNRLQYLTKNLILYYYGNVVNPMIS